VAQLSDARRPDFFIVGAPKCGTTAMTSYLGSHPQIFMPAAKELHFFGSDLDYRRRRQTEAEYLAAFAHARDAKRAGEASVGYLYSERAPHEILRFSPAADALIMLRDPIEMIQSQHAQELFMGQEDLEDLEAALAAEPDRARGRRIPAGSTQPYLLRYTWIARYAEHVARYLDAFGRERVHVTLFDDFSRDTSAAYADVVRFLGCDVGFRPEFPIVNQRKGARSTRLQRVVRDPPAILRSAARRAMPLGARVRLRHAFYRLNARDATMSPMSDTLRRQLRVEFAPDVRRLADLIGRDLTAWLPVEAESRP
jgi:Sulfotransferase domain